ncbi:hypothetical protein C7S16_6146 [Burkholderia thailandensis]|uniref:Uncharacterized protein n=1 Tax=Burkholderia thailandensis TaxID=57975 RepID=A0AAW9CVY0_BURTH|nr:hypothetical protein [Burkholderia thailandensis]
MEQGGSREPRIERQCAYGRREFECVKCVAIPDENGAIRKWE